MPGHGAQVREPKTVMLLRLEDDVVGKPSMSQSGLKITKGRREVWCKKDGGVVGSWEAKYESKWIKDHQR
jgi:hypothetical protein